MQLKSHLSLAVHIVNSLNDKKLKLFQKAFLFGCVSPDINVLTYLKGSVGHKPLKGHDYKSSYGYISKKLRSLQRKSKLNILDFYEIGKVVHYIADDFTYPHNEEFSENLSEHCRYEKDLHPHFETYLSERNLNEISLDEDAVETDPLSYLDDSHKKYRQEDPSYSRDSQYATKVSEKVVSKLLSAS